MATPVARSSRFSLTALVGLVGGFLLLTAVASGAYVAYQALLGHNDLVTAEYAPAGSWAYVAVNVDPTSHAWLDAWTLAKRAGIDDELSRLPEEGLQDSGNDPAIWTTLIKPAVGRELGFAIWPNPEGADAQPHVAAIVMIADREKAVAAVDELLDGNMAVETTYRDVIYQTDSDGSAAGIVDEALIVASSSDAFEGIVDARRDGALNGDDAFVAAAERAGDDPLVFAYVDGAAVADAASAVQDELLDAAGGMSFAAQPLTGAYDAYRDFGQITMTIKADGNTLRTEVLTGGRSAIFPTTPTSDIFADQLPASTLFYFASADLYGSVWQPAMAQYEEMLGATGDESMTFMPAPGDIATMLGVDLEGGMIEQLTGPYAISVSVDESAGEYGGQVHFLAELDDPAMVEDTLDDAMMLAVGLPVEEIEGGYRVTVPDPDVAIEMTVDDDVLHLSGSYGTSNDTETLADAPGFQTAMEGMPSDPTLVGYVATDRIWELLPEDTWDAADLDIRATLESLGVVVGQCSWIPDQVRDDEFPRSRSRNPRHADG